MVCVPIRLKTSLLLTTILVTQIRAIATLDPQAVIEANLDSKQVQVSTHCSEAAIR